MLTPDNQSKRRRPGEVRDAIVQVLNDRGTAANVQEITDDVIHPIGDVPASSVRSYLRLNTPALFASKWTSALVPIAGLETSGVFVESKRCFDFRELFAMGAPLSS